ncbi:MAG TPA: transglutaminase family protein [Opitutaceae bacterium]
MILSVGCSLRYDVLSPTAAFTFNVLVNTDVQQRILGEQVTCVPEMQSERVATSKGNRVVRVEVPAGPFELRYTATVETAYPVLPAEIAHENPGRVPLNILTYALPSRYCESDRLAPFAWELFGHYTNRAEQVRAICAWLDANLTYAPGASDSRTSAWEVWQTRRGVCRDYAHLGVALCRALTIPARYLGCFAAGLEPMDFHACFEAYLGGKWYLFDPTDNIAPENIAVIARGRDAANCALTTIFGRVQAGPVHVTAVSVAPPAPPASSDAAPLATLPRVAEAS